jgi:murein DD-endopeptidase MepM/ murein hydrolase activator NlpD
MAKFRSPFNTNTLSLTQTYHTGSNNTAIDLSATADTPVCAIADGPVTYRSSGAGSYCIQQIDNSDLKVYYVHTYRWVGANTYVKKGQIICYIAPTSLNGGYPTHLHLGLPTGKGIMDYFDRSLVFTTNYADIKAIWFKNGSLDWTLFKDLSYESNAVKIGDNVELSADTNLRVGSETSYNIKTIVVKGAVGNIIGGPRNADGYEWWDVRFLNDQGWMANPLGTRLVKTTKQITQTDGKLPTPPVEPPVDPCLEIEKKSQELERKNLELTNEIKELAGKNADLIERYNGVILERQELISKLSQCNIDLEQSRKNFIEKIKNWIGDLLEAVTRGS